MVRTKASDAGRKAVSAKAPRKALSSNRSAGSTSGSSVTSPKGGRFSGSNPVCDRPTPEWQKDIASFFPKNSKQEKENESPDEEGESSGVTEGEQTENSSGPSQECSQSNKNTEDS